MLVLKRKTGEAVFVGVDQEIKIHILKVKPNGDVTLGIDVSADVPIFRNELVKEKPHAHAATH